MKKAILLSALILQLCSCKPDAKIDFNEIEGKWKMVEATRNGNITSTLDKSFFIFEDGDFTHNINGDTISSTYKVMSNNMIQSDDEIIKEIEVTKLQNDTISFKTKISNFKFEFLMKRIDE